MNETMADELEACPPWEDSQGDEVIVTGELRDRAVEALRLLADAYLPCVTVLNWNVGEQLPDLLNGRCGQCANCKLD